MIVRVEQTENMSAFTYSDVTLKENGRVPREMYIRIERMIFF